MPEKRLPSKPFDTTFKHLIELRPGDIVSFLGVPDVRSVEQWTVFRTFWYHKNVVID